MALFKFAYSEVNVWLNDETQRWFFRVNPDSLVEVDPRAKDHFGPIAHVLTQRAIDDWMTLITPPGPSATSVLVLSDGDGFIKRIFDASVHADGEGAD